MFCESGMHLIHPEALLLTDKSPRKMPEKTHSVCLVIKIPNIDYEKENRLLSQKAMQTSLTMLCTKNTLMHCVGY